MAMENRASFVRREAINWALTGLVLAGSGALLVMFAVELQPAAGMEGLRRYLLAPAGVLVAIGIVLLVASGGLLSSMPWALALLRVISYVLLICFFLGLLVIIVVWFKKWGGQTTAFGVEDLVAAVVIALTLILGLRGFSTLRKLS